MQLTEKYAAYHKEKNVGTWTWSEVHEGTNNIKMNFFVLRKKNFGCVLFHIETYLFACERILIVSVLFLSFGYQNSGVSFNTELPPGTQTSKSIKFTQKQK